MAAAVAPKPRLTRERQLYHSHQSRPLFLRVTARIHRLKSKENRIFAALTNHFIIGFVCEYIDYISHINYTEKDVAQWLENGVLSMSPPVVRTPLGAGFSEKYPVSPPFNIETLF